MPVAGIEHRVKVIEVEIKYRVSYEFASALLARYESSFSEGIVQRDAVYLLDAQTFQEFIPGSPVVRVRTAGESSSITLKRMLVETGDMVEIETAVASATLVGQILSNLGLTLVTDVDKTRKTASILGVEVCVDEVRGLGTFIELELLARDEHEAEASRARLHELAEKLGLSEGWIEPRKYDELLAKETQSDR